MTKGFSVKIHPFFIGVVISCFLLGRSMLLCHVLFCWGVQEGCGVAYAMTQGRRLRQLRMTPLGLRGIMDAPWDGVARHFMGSVAGVILSICLFTMEEKGMAGVSLFLATLRLLPLLPLDGGSFLLAVLGRWRGTLWAARLLTKIGKGIGVGAMIFGGIWGTLYAYDWWIFLGGAYLVYANRHEFLQITKEFYGEMLEKDEEHFQDKPPRGIAVTGEESVLDLAMRLNTKEETFFFRGEQGGISGERVLLALFLGQSATWLWQAADRTGEQ